jgi:hypothetical protein
LRRGGDSAGSPYLAEILRLDPVADHERIVYLDACFEFPFDTTRSLEFALFRTFAAPTIGALLDATGEFGERAQKRYDDTDLILSTIVEHGHSTTTGRAAIRRMNRLHGRFAISNEDFLYVLSTFVYEPIRWNERFGWRLAVEHERLAAFHFWREVGRLMGIRDIPLGFDEFAAFNREYERARFARSEPGRRVAVATREMFLAWFPGLPRPLGRLVLHSIMDPPLLEAFGFQPPPRALCVTVEEALKARSRAVAVLRSRRKPRVRTELRHRSYPNGYALEALGPP